MPTRILLLDCSEASCAVALGGVPGSVRELCREGPRQSTALLPMVAEVLEDAQLAPQGLQVIAYSCGPGSYTGLRAGLSVAQGLAMSCGCPLLPLPSLQSLALQVPEHRWVRPGQRILAALDARMDSVYSALFEVSDDGRLQRLGEDAICALERWRPPNGQLHYAVGSGAKLLAGLGDCEELGPLPVRAASLYPLACELWDAGAACEPSDAVMVYLHGSEAWSGSK